jgi:hypothetical protein
MNYRRCCAYSPANSDHRSRPDRRTGRHPDQLPARARRRHRLLRSAFFPLMTLPPSWPCSLPTSPAGSSATVPTARPRSRPFAPPALHHPQRHRPRNPPGHPYHPTPPTGTSNFLTHGHCGQGEVPCPPAHARRSRERKIPTTQVSTVSGIARPGLPRVRCSPRYERGRATGPKDRANAHAVLQF